MRIHPIPALKDNYIWAISTPDKRCLLVDPGEARPAINWLRHHHMHLSAILVTHHHADHTAGLPTILSQYPVPVYGHVQSPCTLITHHLETDGVFNTSHWPSPIQTYTTPGHTLCHITYVVDNFVFTGDTLFSAGCGKVFEGSMSMMFNSLETIKALPNELLICPGHEYTLHNLAFAETVEPTNQAIKHHIQWAKSQRERNEATLPIRLRHEKNINPFLRCSTQSILDSASQHLGEQVTSPLKAFSTLRHWKDHFDPLAKP